MNETPASNLDASRVAQNEYGTFGDIEVVPLSRIQKVASTFLGRSWTTIPHVTHHDEADITALDAARREKFALYPDIKLSLLVSFIKAAVAALQAHSKLNASLGSGGTHVVLKKYFNVGVAIDTPAGLLVGVIRNCDRKDVLEIDRELAALSHKARTKGLTPEEMSGGSFTLSSLGGIGGTAFTPIINAPEVAILGIARAQWKAQRGRDDHVEWRLMLPLSLSYDHRVVNGADAARFMRALVDRLASPETLI